MLFRRYTSLLSILPLILLLLSGCTTNTHKRERAHSPTADTTPSIVRPSQSTAPNDTLPSAPNNSLPSMVKPSKPFAPNDPLPTADVLIDVEAISQYPSYPTGCESVTAVMALRHAGISITVDDFIDNHLVCDTRFYNNNGLLYGPDPYSVFVGDPRSEYSYGCMAPVIEKALHSCLKDKQQVINTTGTSLLYLCRTYIDQGIPVILWATMEMRSISDGNDWYLEDGRHFTWPAGEHCLLLVGYNDTTYFFNDPLYGRTVAYDKASAEQSYYALGKQSLVIQ